MCSVKQEMSQVSDVVETSTAAEQIQVADAVEGNEFDQFEETQEG